MRQEFNDVVEGDVAGRDIINGDSNQHQTHIHIATNYGQVITGGEIHLHPAAAAPKVKVVIQPGLDCIDDEQKAHLKALVSEVVRLEGLIKRAPKTFGCVWAAVDAKCKATSYHLITQANFLRAEKFLREWIGRLSSAKSAHLKDGNWRNRKFSYIFANVKQLDGDAALRTQLKTRYGSESLKGLSDADLESVYQLIAGWKKAGHAPRQASA